MRRIPVIALALLALSGCPLPQPLAEYPRGTVTPPRILMDGAPHRDTIVRVPAGCPAPRPSYDLSATLVDNDTSETVTARWFVDYDRTNSARCDAATEDANLPGPGDGAQNPTHRQVPTYRFAPYDHPAVVGGGGSASGPGVVHVVELVVSNRFDPAADSTTLCAPGTDAWPFRTPDNDGDFQFETQTFRWVFVSEAASEDVPCPSETP